MAVAMKEWLDLIEREYLSDFIVNGGAAVKFVVVDDDEVEPLSAGLARHAATHRLLFRRVNSASIKLHMIQDVFFAVSRQINWESEAQKFVEHLFECERYTWPTPGEPVSFEEIGAANQTDGYFMRKSVNQWLTGALMKDTRMTQDFRIAVTELCLDRFAPRAKDHDVNPVLLWLRGELRLLGPLKSAYIYSKITRHNARGMLRSLCRWLALTNHSGFLLAIDIRQLAHTAAALGEGTRYTTGAAMDAYEVLRQLIDDSDLFEKLFIVVIAGRPFIGTDGKRSIDAYQALKMRIWDDVRAHDQDNPLAPMVILGH